MSKLFEPKEIPVSRGRVIGRQAEVVQKIEAATKSVVSVANVEKVVTEPTKQTVKTDLQVDQAVFAAKNFNSSLANNGYLTLMAAPLPSIAICKVVGVGGGSGSIIVESTVHVRTGAYVDKKDLATHASLLVEADQTNGIRLKNTSGGALGVRGAVQWLYRE